MLDVRDAVALSLLPAVARYHVLETIREAERKRAYAPRSLESCLPAGGWTGSWRTILGRARKKADAALRRAAAARIAVLPFGDARYPPWLAAIGDPPAVLWLRGGVEAFEPPAVAIVGSRAASHYAIEVAERLAEELAARGVAVVSGLARGVDGAAHRGALAAPGGCTIAVLGSGTDVVYPFEHDELAAEIARRGLLVSEFTPGTRPHAGHFPRRNRIISGLSRAVVIVEAPERSGALITAACALEQGRDVMAVPGNILSARNRGGHALLKDGAKVVESVDDVLEAFGPGWPCKSACHPGSQSDGDGVLSVMEPGEDYDLDSLLQQTGLDGPVLLSHLLELELRGAISRVGSGRFRAVKRKVVT